MMLLDKWRQNGERVRQAGVLALEQAKAASVPAYFRDAAFGEGIVKQMPDGSRLMVDVKEHGEPLTEQRRPRG